VLLPFSIAVLDRLPGAPTAVEGPGSERQARPAIAEAARRGGDDAAIDGKRSGVRRIVRGDESMKNGRAWRAAAVGPTHRDGRRLDVGIALLSTIRSTRWVVCAVPDAASTTSTALAIAAQVRAPGAPSIAANERDCFRALARDVAGEPQVALQQRRSRAGAVGGV
jgi:hypothetical protein